MSRPAEHHPGYKNTHYSISYFCENCHTRVNLKIEKGQPAPKEWTSTPCPNCKCFSLYKAAYQ